MSVKLGYDLKVEQNQKLVMTPELIQAIRILQLNTQELDTYIQEEMISNPVLEQAVAASDMHNDDGQDLSENSSGEEPDVDWQEYLRDRQYDDISYRSHEYRDLDKKENTYELYTSVAETLSEHLMIQLEIATERKDMLRLGEYIIESLDENGYMTLTAEDIAAATDASLDLISETVKLIQTFDPYGAGAYDLGECLIIQMRAAGILDEIYEHLLTEHIDDVAANRVRQAAKHMNISAEEMQQRFDMIKMLEPKPGREFTRENDLRYIVPDIIVEYIEDDYVVSFNDESTPELVVSSYYRNMLSEASQDRELAEYLNSRLDSAVRLIKSIEQRKQTIYKVANAIVSYQKDFFRYGNRHLRTLTMKQISDELGIHESTVSRAVNGKYMQSPRGIFEMKYFFSAGLDRGSGEQSVSSVSIKDYIKEIIDGEEPGAPYSDNDIASMLGEKGITISRRTVAKYRDEMHILSSSKRKRY